MNENLHAVFDSGPLIHLSELGMLSLLNIFNMKFTTDVVSLEVKRHVSPNDLKYLTQWLDVSVHNEKIESGTLRALAKIYSLDSGELSALALCDSLKHKVETVFFSDDSAARMASAGLGINSVGTIGIIIKSATLNIIEKTRALELLDSIHVVSSLYIKRELLNSIMDKLRKEWSIP
jgi:predicted nucleic acid-binding protein